MISSCQAEHNKGTGIHAFGKIKDCSASDNEYYGYFVESRTQIQGCLAAGNIEAGIYLNYSVDGTYATAEDNVMVENGCGLRCDLATGNFIARNKAINNTTNYLIGAGNHYGEIIAPSSPITNTTPWANFSY